MRKFAVDLLQVSECNQNGDDKSSVPLPAGWQRHEGVMLYYSLHLLQHVCLHMCRVTYCLRVAFRIYRIIGFKPESTTESPWCRAMLCHISYSVWPL